MQYYSYIQLATYHIQINKTIAKSIDLQKALANSSADS